MHRYLRRSIFVVIAAVMLAACSRVPDNARYIPADAVAVIGVNLRSLSKKIAWNLITGSKLFKEIQKRMPAKNGADAVGGIENAGFDVSNTFYVYTRADNRFVGGNLLVGLVPLEDAGKWEAYVKQVFPGAEIKQRQGRKEAALGRGLYVGWGPELLILVNGAVEDELQEDPAEMVMAEIDRAFLVPSQVPMTDNKRYADFEKHGYDLSFWLNYGKVISNYTGDLGFDVNGVSLSSAAWKDAVLSCGFDFKKGKIAGDINYYLPAQMADSMGEFGTENADKDMLQRLPKKKMDMLLSMHISPNGVKNLLEKTGLFGITNMTLTAQGMDVDYVLDAFTGDMAISMNDFSLYTETLRDSFMGQMMDHKEQRATMAMTYAVKISKYENFAHLVDMLADNGMMKTGRGYVQPVTYNDSVHLVLDKQYAVISSERAYAEGVVDGSYKDDKMPSTIAGKVYDQPFALCLDIKQLFQDVDPAISSSPRDSAVIAESKKLLDNISLSGGRYKDHAYKFNLEINFINTDENSILELIDFGMRMNDISNSKAY